MGRRKLSKLDLAHAYQQLSLEDDSKQYVVINIHKGLYRYNRLPLGIASAPAVFQRTMEAILKGIPNMSEYLNDILAAGKTEQEHLDTLDKVIKIGDSRSTTESQEVCLHAEGPPNLGG